MSRQSALIARCHSVGSLISCLSGAKAVKGSCLLPESSPARLETILTYEHRKFCLDHRSETAHSCTQPGAWARKRAQEQRDTISASYKPSPKPTVLTHEQQCSDPSCKTLIDTPLVTGVHCPNCNRRYCLKHRFREEHACDKLTPLGARAGQTQRDKGLAALEKLRAWGVAKKNGVSIPQSKSKTDAAARLKATNDLKKTAKGDDKIPQDKRVYVRVEAEKSTLSAKLPNGSFFYNKEWSVGRVLDLAAKSLQVENLNNRGGGEEDKLRVFHVEGGRLLEFSEKLGVAVGTGNTLVLLRGVGPAVPDLIQA